MAVIIDTKVEALKELCAAIKGGATTAESIPGGTVVDVIQEITSAVKAKEAEKAQESGS